MKLNVGGIDRVIRILAGVGLVGWAALRKGNARNRSTGGVA